MIFLAPDLVGVLSVQRIEVTRKDVEVLMALAGLEIEFEWQWRLLLNLLNSGPPYEIRAAEIPRHNEPLHHEVRVKNRDGAETRYYRPEGT